MGIPTTYNLKVLLESLQQFIDLRAKELSTEYFRTKNEEQKRDISEELMNLDKQYVLAESIVERFYTQSEQPESQVRRPLLTLVTGKSNAEGEEKCLG